ncbi:MAG: aspartyl/asparaginyl beta-hydroxylase domain-containing protein [Kofleriaceae bacterium]
MRLHRNFHQLPVTFDAARLLQEAQHFPKRCWRPDRFGIDGYWSLNLVSCEGKDTDLQSTPMRPTDALARCPYTREVLAHLGTPWSEVRFRWLEPGRQVPRHWDANHFWFERLRLHIPVSTDDSVRFIVDDEEVRMKAGECWLFDRLRPHQVVNDSRSHRIHLVMDTVGSDALYDLIESSTSPRGAAAAFESPALLRTHDCPTTIVATSAQVDVFAEDLVFRISEAGVPDGAPRRVLLSAIERLRWGWRAVWAQHGDHDSGWQQYDRLLNAALATVKSVESRPDVPKSVLAAEIGSRIVVFGTTGGRAPVHRRWRPGMPLPDWKRDAVELGEELLFKMAPDGMHRFSTCGHKRSVYSIEDILLMTALGGCGSLGRAIDHAGLVYDDALLGRVVELLEEGTLRAYPPAWSPQLPGTAPAGDVAAYEAAVPNARCIEMQVQIRADVYVRLLEHGALGIWIDSHDRFETISCDELMLLAALFEDARLPVAVKAASLAYSAEILTFLRALRALGVVQFTEPSA